MNYFPKEINCPVCGFLLALDQGTFPKNSYCFDCKAFYVIDEKKNIIPMNEYYHYEDDTKELGQIKFDL